MSSTRKLGICHIARLRYATFPEFSARMRIQAGEFCPQAHSSAHDDFAESRGGDLYKWRLPKVCRKRFTLLALGVNADCWRRRQRPDFASATPIKIRVPLALTMKKRNQVK